MLSNDSEESSVTKVLLVSPPFYRLLGSHFNGASLGLAYLSSVLEAAGVECGIFNADFSPDDRYSDQVELYKGYGEYKRIMRDPGHPIWRECVARILDYSPHWVGFSMFTANLPAVDILSRLLKEEAPKIQIVAGGPHVTLAKDRVLTDAPEVDFAIQGEGEKPMLDLLSGYPKREIRGLIYREGKGIVVNEERPFIRDLDTLPFPNRHRYDLNGQRMGGRFIITSRGCPHNCFFCASPVLWKRKVRFRSVENVIQELKQMKRIGYDFIQFQDDTFTFKKKRLLHLLKRMREENLGLQWICDTRLTSLDEEVLSAMKQTGCVRVKVGIESGNREILKAINKGITPEEVLEKTALIKESGLSLTAYFMVGFPGETDEQALDTIRLAKRIEADYYSLSVVAPYYGTPFYEDFVSRNGHREIRDHWEYFFHQSQDLILTTGISKKVIDEFWALNEYGRGIRI